VDNVESYNYDSVRSAMDSCVEKGIWNTNEKRISDNTEIGIRLHEEEWANSVKILNEFRLNPAKDIDEVIKSAQRIICTEFLIATKL
jgi:hypothetical protein